MRYRGADDREAVERPRALLMAVAVIAAVEAALAFWLPVNQGRHLVDDLLADLERPRPPRPMAIWGDSVTQGALESAGGDPQVADIASTKAVSLAGAFYTYRRLVRASAAPRALVLCLAPDSYDNDLQQGFTPTYFESCFTQWQEISDFLTCTGRLGQALRMAGNRFLLPPSMLRRASMRRGLQSLRSPGGLRTAWVPRLRVLGSDPAVLRELRERAGVATWPESAITRIFLDRLAEETAATGTTLVLMTGALPRSVLQAWRSNGFLAQLEGELRRLAARHPNVRVEPVDQFAAYADEDMYDRLHLKPVPALEYGRRVLERMRNLREEEARR